MPSEFETVITDQTEYGTVITDQGAAIIADCILNGTKLPIVEAGAGDGGGAPIVPVPSQTALVNERWRGEIAGKELSSTTPNMIDVKIVIGEDVGGFTIREMGLFSDTGVLIAVCNTPDAEKVPISAGVSGKLTMIMHIIVADASVLDFIINPSLNTVDREELAKALEEHNADPNAHGGISGGGYYDALAVTIPASGWVAAEEAGNGYHFVCDVAAEGVRSDLVPLGAAVPGSFSAASGAGVLNGCETFDGFIRFFSMTVPAEDIEASVTLLGKDGGGSVDAGTGLGYSTEGNFAGLDAEGSLTDSGKNAGDFVEKVLLESGEEDAVIHASDVSDYTEEEIAALLGLSEDAEG